MATMQPDPHHEPGPLAAWAGAQGEILGRWLEAEFTEPAAGPAHVNAWGRGPGNLSDALSASAKATLQAQADLMHGWAERVAADPRSSKLAVEAAHQMYELALSCTAATGAVYDSLFAALRTIEPVGITATWSGVFRAWQGALRAAFVEWPAHRFAPRPSEESDERH